MKRLIFITNDDGYRAKGIVQLTEIMKPFGDVVVVAPAETRSGMSSALTVATPVRMYKVNEEVGVVRYVCNGTPVDCVKLAMSHVFTDRKPDLLVSGINHGSNAAVSVIYSGTLGAAAEGSLYGIPSIGFSLTDHDRNADFSGAVPYIRQIIAQCFNHPFEKDVFLNVNIPNIPYEDIKGIRLCRQTKGAWVEEFEKRIDPHGFDYYWMTGRFKNFEEDAADTDETVLREGYVAIVPHRVDMTDYDELHRLQKEWGF